MASIEINAINKVYPNGFHAVHDLDISVADGEFMVLVGPSGCGKTTALRMVAGLEEITTGEVRIGAKDVTTLPARERDIAMVFQNYALYPHMTVAQNIGFALSLRKLSKGEIDRRVREAADVLSLTEWLERKPAQLSGGQRQRVAMGRAIVREPSVFLFDEPLSNLDAKLRVQMRFEIQRLHRRLQTTSLYVTHDQVEAMTLGHRIVVMNGGHIEQIGVPSEVYEAPASEFVASFIGSPAMNLLKGRLADDGQCFEVAGNGPRLPIGVSDAAARVAPGRDYTLGIRAEHMMPTPGLPSVAVGVESCELLGADNLAHGRLGDQEIVWRLPPTHRPDIGESIDVALPPQHLHFFDATTGLRVR
ncbi:MAG TPA: sn-glycerol-3-phosphate import ATP-binding protein UgpC [Solirubrobacteraceae bacterium]|nr:sn-glycerol-3-phosphate import ATP-binding protein UgpC [Solirubrobacteraceae bacterium]